MEWFKELKKWFPFCIFNFIDYYSWIELRINGKTFGEIDTIHLPECNITWTIIFEYLYKLNSFKQYLEGVMNTYIKNC